MEGPPVDGWWVVVHTEEDGDYEGWFKDQIGNTIIIEVEPSKIRLGIEWKVVTKLEAYRTRPI